MWRRRRIARAVLVGVVAGCAGNGYGNSMDPPAPAATAIDVTLLLVGDGGAAEPGDPILAAMTEHASQDPDRTVVVFLGDNIYPDGLRPANHPGRREDERRLSAQLDVARSSGAVGVFLAGNHDWDSGGEDGWDAVRRQAAFIEEHGAPSAVMLPAAGCPGPEVLDIGSRLRLVALDTQWWLHGQRKPQHPGSPCGVDSETEVLDALGRTLRDAGDRHVVVAAHHPLESGGPHGGYLGWKAHLFPLRELAPWLWIPLPVVGSAYPIAKNLGIATQDLSSSRYRHLRASLDSVLALASPLAYAAGHEHNLQVMEGHSARYLLVTGAGPSGHWEPAAWLEESLYARRAPGFMRLDVSPDGDVRLAVFVLDEEDRAHETFATWLETPTMADVRP